MSFIDNEMKAPVRLAFHTTGCKVNQFDTESVIAALSDLPVQICSFTADADIVVVNACTVTMNADRDGRAAAYRAARTGARVILAGCMATRLEDQKTVAEIPDDITVVGGTADRSRLIDTIRKMVAETSPRQTHSGGDSRTNLYTRVIENDLPVARTRTETDDDAPDGRSRPLVKIQDGCDCRCSYCIVPLVRGNSRSRDIDDVIGQVRAARKEGAAEVVLTGVDLAAWGKTDDGRYGHLSELIDRLTGLRTGLRFRLSSLEPYGLDHDLIKTIAGNPDVCPHLHIPMQSGADTVLERMNRPYSSARFRELVAAAASCIPGLVLGMDVIVGFPGETDDEFDQTRRMALELPTTYLHVFPYSPRPGTPAAGMPDQIPPDVKKYRGRVMREISTNRRAAHIDSLIGKTVEVVDVRKVPEGMETLAADYTKIMLPGQFDISPLRRMICVTGRVKAAATGVKVS